MYVTIGQSIPRQPRHLLGGHRRDRIEEARQTSSWKSRCRRLLLHPIPLPTSTAVFCVDCFSSMQVKETIQNPELIVAGIEALDTQGEDGLGKRIARAERDLQKVQIEEERAIRLYVSGKIKEDQLDQQRKFILERLETAREKLDDLRARESMASEKRGLMENLVQWAGKFGKGLDDLPDEKRRDVLRLLVDQVLVDRDNNISITLGIPTEDFVSIENEESPYPRRRME